MANSDSQNSAKYSQFGQPLIPGVGSDILIKGKVDLKPSKATSKQHAYVIISFWLKCVNSFCRIGENQYCTVEVKKDSESFEICRIFRISDSEDGFEIELKHCASSKTSVKSSRKYFVHLNWIRLATNPSWLDSSIGRAAV